MDLLLTRTDPIAQHSVSVLGFLSLRRDYRIHCGLLKHGEFLAGVADFPCCSVFWLEKDDETQVNPFQTNLFKVPWKLKPSPTHYTQWIASYGFVLLMVAPASGAR